MPKKSGSGERVQFDMSHADVDLLDSLAKKLNNQTRKAAAIDAIRKISAIVDFAKDGKPITIKILHGQLIIYDTDQKSESQ